MMPDIKPGTEHPEQSQQTSAQSSSPETQSKPKRLRGLAAADPETRKLVAKKGGEAVSRNRKHMADIGRKGGEAVSQDRKHMASIGRKGGEAVSQNREHMAEIGRKGGEARGSRTDELRSQSQDAQGDEQAAPNLTDRNSSGENQ